MTIKEAKDKALKELIDKAGNLTYPHHKERASVILDDLIVDIIELLPTTHNSEATDFIFDELKETIDNAKTNRRKYNENYR